MMQSQSAKENDAKDIIGHLYDLNVLVNSGLDHKTIHIIASMVENGISPVAIATIIKDIRNESLSNSWIKILILWYEK